MTDHNGDSDGRGGNSPPRASFGRFSPLVFMLAAALVGYLAAGGSWRRWLDRGGAVRDFEIMRTYGRISVPEGTAAGSAAELAERAERAVRRVNDLMGPKGPASDVRRLNEAAAGEWVEVDSLTWTVVMEALRWHRLTGGAFDPTIGPVKRLFTFNRQEMAEWPDDGTLAAAREKVGADKLLFEREGLRLAWAVDGMRLDLGAVAKGFAADEAARVLARAGVSGAMVDIGGELRLIGRKPGPGTGTWKAGIRDPRDGDMLEVLELADAAVATSGDYEQYFTHRGKRYEHIIDPRAGLPLAEGVASVTVIHPDSCLAADALATSLCVLGPEGARKFFEEQALGLFSGGVRVIMLVVREEGGVRRIEFETRPGGELSIVETAPDGKERE